MIMVRVREHDRIHGIVAKRVEIRRRLVPEVSGVHSGIEHDFLPGRLEAVAVCADFDVAR